MRWLDVLKDMFSLERLVKQGTQIALIVIVSWLVYVVVRRLLGTAASAASKRIEEEAHRQRVTTLVLLIGSIVKYVIIFFAGMMVLDKLGVNPAPILAGAGVVGLAVGFGAQNLVRDVVSGFFIIMEGQYAVGDMVEINGVFGRVEEVGLRVTKIRDAVGQLLYFPNGGIRTANNYTEDYVSYFVTVPVPREGLADPMPVVKAILDDFEDEFRVFVGQPTLRVEDLPSYARAVRVRVRAIPGRQALLEQKLPARLAAGLERAGHPLPAGTEVSVSLRYPPPGAGAY